MIEHRDGPSQPLLHAILSAGLCRELLSFFQSAQQPSPLPFQENLAQQDVQPQAGFKRGVSGIMRNAPDSCSVTHGASRGGSVLTGRILQGRLR